MTDRLGGSGAGAPRFNPIGGPQAPGAVGPLGDHPYLPPPPLAAPRYASDGLAISETTQQYYAALLGGPAAPDLDPELLLRLQMVHGPASPFYEAMRASAAGRERLAGPIGLVPAEPGPDAEAASAAPSPMSAFFSRTLQDLGFAWRNFAESQRW